MTRTLFAITCLYVLCMSAGFRSAAQSVKRQTAVQELDVPLKLPVDTGHIARMLKEGLTLMETNPDSGVLLCRQTLETCHTAGYAPGIARSLYGIGIFHSLNEDYDQAISCFLQAVSYAGQDTTLFRTVSSCIYNIGECNYRKGAYGLAAYYYYKALGMITGAPKEKKFLMNLYNRLAALWTQLKVQEQAFYYSGMQERMAFSANDSPALAIAWSTKGGLYLAGGVYDSATMYYSRALTIEKMLGSRSLLSNQQVINNNLALIYIKLGNPTLAIPHAKEALRLPPANGSLLGTIDARCMLGYAYAGLKQYQKAEGYLRSALQDAEAKGLTSNTIMIRFALANIYRYTGRHRDAMLQLYDYIHLTDSIRGEKNAQAAGLLESKHLTSEKDRQLAEKQIELLQHQHNIRTKNTWIAGISAGTLLLSVTLIALYRNNRHKQRLQSSKIQMLQQKQELIGLRAMINGEEKERARIARELHDGIGGMLAAIKMNMNTVQEQNTDSSDQANIGKLMRMVEETTTEVRKTAHNLMPDILTRHSLSEALQIYCEHINTAAGPQIQLKLYGSLSGLDKHIELTLYRIIQELTQNIIKHAHATEAVIEVSRTQEMINITAEDNGQGFDPEVSSNGFGLQNLRYRVQALRGDISIESAPGIGTTILLEFNLIKLHHTFTT